MFDVVSVAVHVTVVTPSVKVDPDAGTHAIVEPGQLSVAVAVKVTTAWPDCGGVSTIVMFAGHVATGASASLTVTVNEHCAVFDEASVAVHVTVVTPRAKVAPDAGEHDTVAPGQLSEAVGVVKFTTAEHCPAAVVVVMFAGHVIVGFWLSTIVTVKVHCPVLLLASVAVQVTVVVPTAKVDPEAGVHVVAPTPGQLSVAAGVV